LSFGNKNPETKFKILFWTKKSGIDKYYILEKEIRKRDYCVSEIKMKNSFRIKKSVI